MITLIHKYVLVGPITVVRYPYIRLWPILTEMSLSIAERAFEEVTPVNAKLGIRVPGPYQRSVSPSIENGGALPLTQSASSLAEPQAKVKPSEPWPTFSHRFG